MTVKPQDEYAHAQTVDSAIRRSQALALRREGKTYEKIGEIMGVTKQRAHQQVLAALAERREELRELADDVRTLELDRLDRLLRIMLKRIDDPRNERPEATATAIVRLMERRAALLGLDAPKDMRLGGIPGGVPIPSAGGLNTAAMSVADLEALERLYEQYGAHTIAAAPAQAALPAPAGETTSTLAPSTVPA